MGKEEQNLVDKVAIAAARELVKNIDLDDKQVMTLTCEILSQKILERFKSEVNIQAMLGEAQKDAKQKIADIIYEETKLS